MKLFGGLLILAQVAWRASRRSLYITDEPQHESKQPICATPELLLTSAFNSSPLSELKVGIPTNLPRTTHNNPATMPSGEVLKADKDFTKEADVAIPEAEKLGAVCISHACGNPVLT